MNGYLKDFLNRNWKTLVTILTVLISWIYTLNATVESTKLLSAKVEVLDTFHARQTEINKSVEKQLDRIELKIDKILGR